MLDTGSMVTTMPESMFQSMVPELVLQEEKMVKLKAANGLRIRYKGVITTDVKIDHLEFKDKVIFITSSDAPNPDPCLLDMNVTKGHLKEILDYCDINQNDRKHKSKKRKDQKQLL